MTELKRHILIVDDSKNIEADIRGYKNIFDRIKKQKKLDFNLEFTSVRVYEEAISILKDPTKAFDVLIIDYDLAESGNSVYGDELIVEIRSNINKHCKIIFYTMGELSQIFPNRTDLIKLFNKGIYRFLTKDLGTQEEINYGPRPLQLRVETIIEAINDIDFIQVTLENYFSEYSEIIQQERIKIEGTEYSVSDLITLIRQDTKEAKIYKSNLAESIILHNIIRGES